MDDSNNASHLLFCTLGPMASASAYAEMLGRHNLVHRDALEDPEGYDDYQTLNSIGEAYDEIKQHLQARAEEAMQKLNDMIDEMNPRYGLSTTESNAETES